jgi:tryptophan synthase beta chain
MESKKFLLQEKDIPTAWYNIVADMENKPSSAQPQNKGTAQA